jgi:hypothetical protein
MNFPKIELRIHLERTVRPETPLEIARLYRVGENHDLRSLL